MSFPRYEKYKESGMEWLGDVPAHWRVERLKNLIDRIESGTSVNSVDTPAGEGEFGVLKTSCVYRGQFDPEENKAVVAEEYERLSCPVVAGTLIASRMNTPDLVGAAGVVRQSHSNLYLPDRLWQVHLKDAVAEYVHFWTNTRAYRMQVEMACAGTSSSMQNLGQDAFRVFALATPPRAEQLAIATFLGHETAKIDALVEEQRRLIELLKEKRQAVISQAVTKGLNPSAPMKDSGVAWLGKVPAHWDVSRLRYVARPGTSITYGVVQAGPHIEDGIPYIKTSDMSGPALPLDGYSKTTAEIDAFYARSKVAAGDLVIAIRASVGKCLPVPAQLDGANLTQGTAKIAPGDLVDAGFLLAYINALPVQTYLNSVSKGATFKEITLDTLRKTPVLVPPLTEQRLIASQVHDLNQQFQELIDSAEAAEALLLERRTALISAAITGKIDVRSLVPQLEAVAA